jgi:hypothetical protein
MKRLWTPAWVARHVFAAVLVMGFLALGWWQFRRASGGNALSWAYTFEWPLFAGFVIFIWFREVRLALHGHGPDRARAHRPAPGTRRPVVTVRRATATTHGDADDPALAAYNEYLAWLNANPRARPTDYPG